MGRRASVWGARLLVALWPVAGAALWPRGRSRAPFLFYGAGKRDPILLWRRGR